MYRKTFETPFHPLLDKLNCSEYTGSRVKPNPSRCKTGWGCQKSTQLHNVMEAREGNSITLFNCICYLLLHNEMLCLKLNFVLYYVDLI